MNIEELKMQAVEFAKKFKETDIMPDFENYDYNISEWWLIMTLAQVYYNFMQGNYTREQALREQKKAISLVQNNEDVLIALGV